jgi:phosphohistidine phosphatase
MKNLYLVRHAKAGWHDPALADFDRALTKKGRWQAEQMSWRLHKKGVIPERLVSSPANRAIETAEIFADTLGIDRHNIMQRIEIYEGGAEALAAVVRALSDQDNTVMLFGHNPAISHFIQWLTGKSANSMETCGIARIDIAEERWNDAGEGCGKLIWYEYPERE